MVNRCLGALAELPVVEALSFLDLMESDRFLTEAWLESEEVKGRHMRQGSLRFE